MRHRERKRLKAKEEEALLGSSVCRLCKEGPNEEQFGKFFTEKETGFSVHQYCMFFSSGLAQCGEDDEGFDGFLLKDIKKEISRSRRLRCNFCKKLGATIGCCERKCTHAFHYKCGRESGSLFQFFDRFNSYCRAHRPTQDINFVESKGQTCPVCLCKINPSGRISLDDNPIKTPCCRNSWFHHSCLQRHAHSSGLHYFRCPICNNMDQFQQEMRRMGIYIPEQDASWERDDAFADLLFQYSRCDAKRCICPHGREHEETSGKWRIRLCDLCGQSGTHLKCQHWRRSPGEWHCDACGNTLPHSNTRRRHVGDHSMDPYTSDEDQSSSATEDCEVNVCTISDDDVPLKRLKSNQEEEEEEEVQIRGVVKAQVRDGASPMRKRCRMSGTFDGAGPSNLEEYFSQNSRCCASYIIDSLHSSSETPSVLLTLSNALYPETVARETVDVRREVETIMIRDSDSECSSQASEEDVKIIAEKVNAKGDSKTDVTAGVKSIITVDSVGLNNPESRIHNLAKLNSACRAAKVVEAEADSSGVLDKVKREPVLSAINLLNVENTQEHDSSDDDACLIVEKPCPVGNDKFGKCMLTCCNPTKFFHLGIVAPSSRFANCAHKDLQIKTVSSTSSFNRVAEKSDADRENPYPLITIDEVNESDTKKEFCSVGTNTIKNIAPSVTRDVPSRQARITEMVFSEEERPSSPSGQKNILSLRRKKNRSFRERRLEKLSSLPEHVTNS